MRMTKKWMLGVAILAFLGASSQNSPSIEIHIGDSIPDIELNNIINFKLTKTKISEFKDKLLILDFWGTWCSPCIAAFPKLDSLQKKFNEKIQILSVTEEDGKKVGKFLEKMKKITGLEPPSITDDKILRKYFSHTYLPHYVWINPKGKVVAITDGADVNVENIQLILNGNETKLPEKIDLVKKFVREKDRSMIIPGVYVKKDDVIALNSLPQTDLIVNSSLTRYLEGFGLSGGTFFPKGCITAKNIPISLLYSIALGGAGMNGITGENLIVDIENPELYKHITGKEKVQSGDTSAKMSRLESIAWKRANVYCYDLSIPATLDGLKFKVMLENLNTYFGSLFGIEGLIEKRSAKYLALIRTEAEKRIESNGGKPTYESDKFSLKIKNNSLSTLVLALSLPLQRYPQIIDETGYNCKVDIELNCKLSDLDSVNKELSQYGLQLIEKEKQMDVPVIRMKHLKTIK